MERVYERRHPHESGGVIVSTVAEDDTTGLCAVTVRCISADGRTLEPKLWPVYHFLGYQPASSMASRSASCRHLRSVATVL